MQSCLAYMIKIYMRQKRIYIRWGCNKRLACSSVYTNIKKNFFLLFPRLQYSDWNVLEVYCVVLYTVLKYVYSNCCWTINSPDGKGQDCWIINITNRYPWLQGQCHEIFTPSFYSKIRGLKDKCHYRQIWRFISGGVALSLNNSSQSGFTPWKMNDFSKGRPRYSIVHVYKSWILIYRSLPRHHKL